MIPGREGSGKGAMLVDGGLHACNVDRTTTGALDGGGGGKQFCIRTSPATGLTPVLHLVHRTR